MGGLQLSNQTFLDNLHNKDGFVSQSFKSGIVENSNLWYRILSSTRTSGKIAYPVSGVVNIGNGYTYNAPAFTLLYITLSKHSEICNIKTITEFYTTRKIITKARVVNENNELHIEVFINIIGRNDFYVSLSNAIHLNTSEITQVDNEPSGTLVKEFTL